MNTLGASAITCETFGEVTVRRGVKARVFGQGGPLTQQRIENSGFDFRHIGVGSAPRDPRPLRWAHEPGFSAAVSSVLENGAAEVDIHIRSNRTHAVDGTLGIKLKKLGFELGEWFNTRARLSCTSTPTSHRRGRAGSREGSARATTVVVKVGPVSPSAVRCCSSTRWRMRFPEGTS